LVVAWRQRYIISTTARHVHSKSSKLHGHNRGYFEDVRVDDILVEHTAHRDITSDILLALGIQGEEMPIEILHWTGELRTEQRIYHHVVSVLQMETKARSTKLGVGFNVAMAVEVFVAF